MGDKKQQHPRRKIQHLPLRRPQSGGDRPTAARLHGKRRGGERGKM